MNRAALATLCVLLLTACGTSHANPIDATACGKAFKAAAAIDDMHDDVSDLDDALTSCRTLKQWTAASNAHPAALDGVAPADFAFNRCGNADVINLRLCKHLQGSTT